jgi:DNA-directed RNA polymerase subunit K/omega
MGPRKEDIIEDFDAEHEPLTDDEDGSSAHTAFGDARESCDEEEEDNVDIDDDASAASVSSRVESNGCDAARLEILVGDSRKSAPLMTQYEFTRLVSVRATHLSMGASPCVEPREGGNVTATAIAEVLEGVCPYIIRRHVSSSLCEDWHSSELVVPAAMRCYSDVAQGRALFV